MTSNTCKYINSEQDVSLFEIVRTQRRKLFTLIAGLPLLAACSANSGNLSRDPEDVELRQRFRGLHGVVLRIDSATIKRAVTITTESGRMVDGSSTLSPKNVSNLSYSGGSLPIPKTVRATWREGDFRFQGSAQGMWKGGTIVGDYTVPVAARIPDELLNYIRTRGGALRIKIRLKDDGILIGWDVEERVPKRNWKPGDGAENYIRHSLPGGDFREADVHNGKVVDPGWEK